MKISSEGNKLFDALQMARGHLSLDDIVMLNHEIARQLTNVILDLKMTEGERQ
jgi:hypothetical protein